MLFPLKLIPAAFLALFPHFKYPTNDPLNAAEFSPLISSGTSTYIKELLQRWNSTGLSVAAVRRCNDNETCWIHEFGSYGIAKEDGSAMSPDTVFNIASNSKLFLAISMGLLISNESLSEDLGFKLDWNTRISDLIPEWKLMDNDATLYATIQDLLSHRTGLPRHDLSRFPTTEGPLGIIKTLRYLNPSAEFRETFQYNNLMYITLSHFPQRFLNQSYISYVSDNLFKPLGMTSTTFYVDEAKNLAQGYVPHMRDLTKGYNGTKVGMPYFIRSGDEAVGAGPGGILSSTRDMAVGLSMLMNKGRHPYNSNRIVVPEAVIDHVIRGITVRGGVADFPEMSPKVYGAGQFRYSYQGHDILEHGGSNTGFMSQIARFPDDNLGIITLSNDNDGTPIVEAAKWRIAEDVIGLKKVDWMTRFIELQNEGIRQMKPAPRPSPPIPPTHSFQRLAAKSYYQPAYGTLSPCLANTESAKPQTHTARCHSVISSPAAKQILSATNHSLPTFIIPWDRTYATHIRLTHFSKNIFNASVIGTNLDFVEDGENGYLLGLDYNFEVEWVHARSEGLAFRGNFWGREGVDSRSPAGVGKESAEVWFKAV